MKNEAMDAVKRILITAFGLIICGTGVYLTIKANIGLSPWDCLSMGFAYKFGTTYGFMQRTLGFVIIGIDLLLKEKIGVGSILDALIIGTVVDILDGIIPFPVIDRWYYGVLVMTAGMFVIAIGQYFYMKSGLSCGPRDALMLALGRVLHKLPIGLVEITILATVLVVGAFMGAPIGIGSVLSTFGIGITMQMVFNLIRFEPRLIRHENIFQTFRHFIKHQVQ